MSGYRLSETSGWFSGVDRVESPNCDARPDDVEVELIVVHAISLPPGEFGGGYIEQLFTNTLDPAAHRYFDEIKDRAVSAHLVIDRAGAVTQFVGLHQRAWHAGESRWRGRAACNDFSVGIELEGCDTVPFTAPQYAALTELVAEMLRQIPSLSVRDIVGHCDIAPGRKTDPGPLFAWDRFTRSLAAP